MFIKFQGRKHSFFDVQPNNVLNLRHEIFICGDTLKPYCIQLQFKMKTHFTNAFFFFLVPVKTFATAPVPL